LRVLFFLGCFYLVAYGVSSVVAGVTRASAQLLDV